MMNSNGTGAHADAGRNRPVRLDRILAELVGQVPEVEAAAVVSFDGLPMASALPVDMDEDRVAAMSAALLSLGERAAEGLGRGELSQVYVEGENGNVFLVSADDEAVLVAVTAKGAKVGMMLFEIRRAAEALGRVLRVEAVWTASEPAADEPSNAQDSTGTYEPAVSYGSAVSESPAATEFVVQSTWHSQAGSLGSNGASNNDGSDVQSWS
jgi:predicted regulator of Ras-like GTPase activity (Roadblock/LC7/MglB family)